MSNITQKQLPVSAPVTLRLKPCIGLFHESSVAREVSQIRPIIFNLEDGGCAFLRNADIHQRDYTVAKPRESKFNYIKKFKKCEYKV
jgi:hypothetical protein